MLLSTASFAQNNVKIMKNGKMVAQVFNQSGWEFKYGKETSGKGAIDGHEYVEIGGVKWATMNVGASGVATNWETSCGDFFIWSCPRRLYTSLTQYNENSVRFDNVNVDSVYMLYDQDLYKLYRQYIPVYDKEILNAENDPATVNWGSKWRTPTSEDYEALINACNTERNYHYGILRLAGKITKGGIYWITKTQTYEPEYTGVEGLLFVEKANPSRRVFFPAYGESQTYNYLQFKNYYNRSCGSYMCSNAHRENEPKYTGGYWFLSFEFGWLGVTSGQKWLDGPKPVRAVAR